MEKPNDRVVDVTPPLSERMPVYPGNSPLSIRTIRDVEEGARSTLSEITLGTHSGLHVDAPAHFIAGAAKLEEMPLDALVGSARVIEVDAAESIGVADVERHEPGRGERLLIKTRNSRLWEEPEFREDYVYLSSDAAHYLADRGLLCLGLDYLSVAGRENGVEVHQTLLAAGMLLIEGLDLSEVQPGTYDLVCLPLRLVGAEAAPARAILRPLG